MYYDDYLKIFKKKTSRFYKDAYFIIEFFDSRYLTINLNARVITKSRVIDKGLKMFIVSP